MAKIKHESLSLNQGIYTANMLMQDFYGEQIMSFQSVWDDYKEGIIESGILKKPLKWTLVHWWIDYYSDPLEELDVVKKNADDKEYFIILKDYLIDTELVPDLEEPDFQKKCDWDDLCNIENCERCKRLEAWEKHLEANLEIIKKRIIHGTFQIMFSNRRFMHDFNLLVAEIIETDKEYLYKNYPQYLNKGKIKRTTYWPVWLKEALLYRDKGTCVLCRDNITGTYNISANIEIDHIIPLNLYGTNDSTNFQLLCKSCNTSKQDRSTASNSVNVPFWNI